MKTSTYFTRTDNNETTIKEAHNGRYGYYAKYLGYNSSEKSMRESGYDLVRLTKEEATQLLRAQSARIQAEKEEGRRLKLAARAEQVTISMAGEPFDIEPNIGGSPFVERIANVPASLSEAYRGCGKGTAYIKDDKVIAFHYGYDKPANAPSENIAMPVQVEFSCYQICFL